MEMSPPELYHPRLLEHNRTPHGFEKRPGAQITLEAINPLCGDRFTVYLDISDGVIAKASFHGYGCAVSKASASVLMQKIQGRPVGMIRNLVTDFLQHLQGDATQGPGPDDPELALFLPARRYPGRLGCATLAWESLHHFLQKTS